MTINPRSSIQNINNWRLWIWSNLIIHQPDIEKVYLYTKDPDETKHQILINKQESTGLKHLNDFKAFIKQSNDMDNNYEYSPNKKGKILIVFDDMIADTLNNRKLNLIVTELFIRGRKVNISLVFTTQSDFAVPKKYLTKFYLLLYYGNFK